MGYSEAWTGDDCTWDHHQGQSIFWGDHCWMSSVVGQKLLGLVRKLVSFTIANM